MGQDHLTSAPSASVGSMNDPNAYKHNFIERDSIWLETLSTEKAERTLVDQSTRRLALHLQRKEGEDENSRNSFTVSKDGESAYLIIKTKEFVAEAMDRLTKRAEQYKSLAIWCYVASVALLVAGYIVSVYFGTGEPPTIPDSLDDQAAVRIAVQWAYAQTFLKILAASGLFFVLIKSLLATAKAAMHEHVKNIERRHAMRFGWLYMELAGRDWTFEHLKEAFQWNREGTSAFRDIDLRQVSDTTLSALLARLNEMSTLAETEAAKKAGEAAVAGRNK